MAERIEQKIEGCLVAKTIGGEITFPQKNILVCEFCPNKSNKVGDLGKVCVK